jgi:hypothetical protein
MTSPFRSKRTDPIGLSERRVLKTEQRASRDQQPASTARADGGHLLRHAPAQAWPQHGWGVQLGVVCEDLLLELTRIWLS